MYVEICTTQRSRKDPRRAFRRFPSVIRTGKNMYRIQAEDRKLRKIRRICKRRKYELKRTYPENWGRSSSYRRDFLSACPRPRGGYRCRYCHRRLSDQKLTIDHIYPVYMTKTGNNFWMRLIGIDNVNDVRNLAPACRKCNIKKGRKTGIWIIKAIVGKYELYWVIRRIFQLVFLALIVLLVIKLRIPVLICTLITAIRQV